MAKNAEYLSDVPATPIFPAVNQLYVETSAL
jgi:hypothetical protein